VSERVCVVFSGGGTGGHLYPALALSEALEGLRPDVRSFFVGARRGIEARVLPARGVEHILLPVEGFERGQTGGGFRRRVRVIWNLLRALAELGGAFTDLRPQLVVVTGGYAGGPAGLLALLLGIPLVLQEQNAVPGVTTRLLALWAREIHVAYPEVGPRLPLRSRSRVRISGNPVRPPASAGERGTRREEAAAFFGLDPRGPVLLVVGGSQGSEALNRAILALLDRTLAPGGAGELPGGARLLWSTGPQHLEGVEAALSVLTGGSAPSWLRVLGYIEAMPQALALADLAVSRAGAMATSEFLAWGIPAVLIPLPTAAADHQTGNARALEGAGAALHLPESALEPALAGKDVELPLEAALSALLGDSHRREAMADRARARGRPHAALEMGQCLETLLPPPRDRPHA
jgi:UDP-N-acetylglucosamine--N-acetylmuramyl-(pentapeptide) pyrophosphoryl-undecaprenol N-acetylglucosamine transferase